MELGKLINTYHFQDHNNHQVIKKVFEVKMVKGKIKTPPREIADARWFTFSEIKEMNPAELTFGAIQSIQDFISKKYNQTYYPDRIA